MQYNILDVHPAAVISAFHQNVRNRKMREELAMNKVKDVAELYVLTTSLTLFIASSSRILRLSTFGRNTLITALG